MQGTDTTHTTEPAVRNAPCHAGMAQAIVAYTYDITLDDMLAVTRRGPKPALARQIAMYLSHIVLKMGVSEVAEAFERHRSTVCHALHHIEDMRDDAEFDRTVLYLETTLRHAAGRAA